MPTGKRPIYRRMGENLLHKLLDVFYPRFCYGCHNFLGESTNRYLCISCWRVLPIIREGICRRCGTPLGKGISQMKCCACDTALFRFDEVRAAGKYSGLLKDLLLAFKFYRQVALRYPLAAILSWQIRRHPFPQMPDLITAVPLSSKTMRTRGYNQADLIASLVAKNLQLFYLPEGLIKLRDTLPQSSLDRAQRRQNLRFAFSIPTRYRSCFRGKRVLLIDDVLTTGSTAHECATTLKEFGVTKVYIATVSRTVH